MHMPFDNDGITHSNIPAKFKFSNADMHRKI